MKFLTTSGKQLEISPEFINPCYVVDIIGETEKDYLVSDINKIEIHFPKEIIKINGISVGNNWIDLGESLYENYFRTHINKIEFEANKRLLNSFGEILENKELIFKNPEYFLIRTSFLHSGCWPGPARGFSYCLGGLLEYWENSDDLKVKTDEGTMFLISITGSCLSGSHACALWNIEKKEIYWQFSEENKPSPLKGGVTSWVWKFKPLSEQFKIKMRVNHIAINKLLDQIC